MFELPQLKYAYNALEPHIDARTMEIHHTKHHQAYIDKLKAALDQHPDLKEKGLDFIMSHIDEVPEDIRAAVRNNGGGHYNHTLFWDTITPNASGKPTGELAAAIDATFQNFENFQTEFTNAALTRFGSGWAWLAMDADKKLKVYSTPNQDNPLMQGEQAIIGLDVWEHAYYLNYQNRRPDYITAWWNIVDWDQANKNYLA